MKLLIIFNLLFSTTVFAKTNLLIGTVNYPPYFTFKNDIVDGKLTELINKKLSTKYQITWKEIPLARGTYALNKGLIDIYVAYTKASGVDRNVQFSTKPYYSIQPIICSNDLKTNFSVKKIKKSKIIYPTGAGSTEVLNNKENIFTYMSYSEDYSKRAFKMIKFKRADYVLFPENENYKNRTEEFKEANCKNIGKKLNLYLSSKKVIPF